MLEQSNNFMAALAAAGANAMAGNLDKQEQIGEFNNQAEGHGLDRESEVLGMDKIAGI